MRRTLIQSLRTAAIIGGILWAAAAHTQEPGSLELGDKAPELDVIFLQGDPVEIQAPETRHVFIVEFWATWCGPCRYSIPHLTELQEKYDDDGLVVVGISNETSSLVRPYMEQMGKKMTYRVAIDRNNETNRRYFWGFNVRGTYPHAFVIDANGRVAWIGHPMDPFMETMIQRLLEDRANPPEPSPESNTPDPVDSDE